MSIFCASLLAFLAVVTSHLIQANEAAQLQVVLAGQQQAANSGGYFGSLIGKLEGRSNNVSGLVYAVDEQTIFIRGFTYDGLAPDTYFWSSVIAQEPTGESSFIVPDEKGSTKPLERYLNKDLVLRLPEGKTLREIHWLSVWSRGRRESLADLQLHLRQSSSSSSSQFSIPRPLEISPFTQLAHGLRSGPITIVDAQTFLVPDFHYDGLGPAAFFWLSRGKQGLQPAGLNLKDENGNSGPLRKYQGETVVISLPEELTIYEFDYFGLWCKEYGVSFGHTKIPQTARVPPSPKMLGIKPENKLNCEILYDELGFEIRWVLDGDDIVMQLVGKIEPGEYMAFGLGKDDARSEMNGADAAVAWVDRASGQVHAVDYYLGSKQQCSPPEPASSTGSEKARTDSCPDAKLPGGGDSLTLLHGAIVNGYSMVTFKRPQLGVDERYDQHVYSDGQQSILWAIGPLNARNEIGYHRLRTRNNLFIDFARHPQWNCPVPDLNATMHSQQLAQPVSASGGLSSSSDLNPATPVVGHHLLEASASSVLSPTGSAGSNFPYNQHQSAESAISVSRQQAPASGDTPPITTTEQSNPQQASAAPWFVPAIVCPPESTLYAQIGPTGGHRGFEGVTGRQSWGVAWYINGLMVPELVLERGQAYRFIVEGGNDKTSTTRRHPFYLTDNPEGGFDFKLDDQRLKERILAGVGLRTDGQFVPTAEGRLCEWKQTNQTLANPDLYPSFAAYQRTLKLECLPGQAGMLKFTPDSNTPDLIYYQCYTHPYMGWRIRIVDSCSAYLSAQKANNSNLAGITQVGSLQRTGSLSVNPLNSISKRDLRSSSSSFTAQPFQSTTSNANQIYEKRSFPSSTPSTMAPLESTTTTIGETEARAIERQGLSNLLHELNTLDDIPGFTNEMLVLNSSLLAQRQPLNLSSFDEVLKLSPSDLEFIDKQQPMDSVFESVLLQSSPFGTLFPFRLSSSTNNFTDFTQQVAGKQAKQQQIPAIVSNNRTFARQAKTLQNYIRRLASIYYPVQQQLTSILNNQQQQQSPSNSQTTTASSVSINSSNKPLSSSTNQLYQQNKQQLLTSPSEQTSSFSLSSLVPKSKIDLSKSGISKKLNKFRFKSNKQQTEQQAAASSGASFNKQVASQPPTPAIEFNYDIFNNQLAELEKHNKQLQDLELLSWPLQQQQPQMDSINYMPMLTAASAEQPASEFGSVRFMSSSPFMSTTAATQTTAQHQYQAPNPNIVAANRPLSNLFQQVNPHQINNQQQMPARPANQQPQHNHMLDYLALMFHENRTAGNQQHQQQEQQDLGRFMSQQQQFQSQPAIFVARMPVPAPINSHFPHRPAQWPAQQSVAQNTQPLYNHNHPPLQLQQQQQQQFQLPQQYQQQQQHQQHPMQQPYQQSWLSSQLRDQQEDVSMRQVGQQQSSLLDEPSESLSGSGSGAHYDFRQQPAGGESLDQEDHIVAMERFSKQPSERLSASIVHPIIGEQLSPPSRSSDTSGFIKQHNHQTPIQQKQRVMVGGPAESLDVEQAQLLKTELTRVNSTMPTEQPRITTTFPSATTSTNQPEHQSRPVVLSTAATTVSPSLSGSSAGPLIPLLGPNSPLVVSANKQQQLGLRSTNLLEPSSLASTILHSPFSPLSSSQPTNFINPNNYETSPFTPIEITGNSQQQQQQYYLHQQFHRLRPPPLVESMMAQHLNPFRPEPPVQVASFLAQHLMNQHHPHSEQLMSSSSDKSHQISSSVRPDIATTKQSISNRNETQNYRQHSNFNQVSATSASNGIEHPQQRDMTSNELHNTNELIILKPALPLNNNTTKSKTYLLKPEYLTHTHQVAQPIASLQQHLFAPDHELYYTASNALKLDDEVPSRFLADYHHQFDRLSSLSSNDIALDPIHVATSIQKSQLISSPALANPDTSANSSAHYQMLQSSSLRGSFPGKDLSSSIFSSKYINKLALNNTAKNNTHNNQLAQQTHLHHQNHIPIALGYEEYQTPSAQSNNSPDAISPTSTYLQLDNNSYNNGYSSNSALNIDNNTDNAILSHVMSLIHSNAIPTPPLIPVTTYSNADYFLPISDRTQRSIRG